MFFKSRSGLDLLDNITLYKDQGIKENFKLKLIAKDIDFVSGKIKETINN